MTQRADRKYMSQTCNFCRLIITKRLPYGTDSAEQSKRNSYFQLGVPKASFQQNRRHTPRLESPEEDRPDRNGLSVPRRKCAGSKGHPRPPTAPELSRTTPVTRDVICPKQTVQACRVKTKNAKQTILRFLIIHLPTTAPRLSRALRQPVKNYSAESQHLFLCWLPIVS
jgi:hypothetical protein